MSEIEQNIVRKNIDCHHITKKDESCHEDLQVCWLFVRCSPVSSVALMAPDLHIFVLDYRNHHKRLF